MNKKFIAGYAVCLILPVFAALGADDGSRAVSPSVSSKETPSPSPTPSASAANPGLFHGMVSAIDSRAKTFTIAGKQKSRVFKITPKTAITRNGTSATMADISENEEVHGTFLKKIDGTLEAKTITLGSIKHSENATRRAEKSKKDSPAATVTPSPRISPKP